MMQVATIVLLLSSLALPALSQTNPGITGTVRDSMGAVIANAKVFIHWDPAGSSVGLSDNVGIPSNLTVTTDAKGEYSAQVPPGFYDVFVASTAFSPVAGKVRVKKDKPGTFSPRLKLDPAVSRELD
jgi:hypothetical protein